MNIHDANPWLTPGAQAWLNSHRDKQWTVLEFGSGGSTVYFAMYTHVVISVEHAPVYRDMVVAALDKRFLDNAKIYFVPSVKKSVGDVVVPSRYAGMEGYDFEKYVAAIDHYPDEFFDFCLVDGRARNHCIKHCIPKLKVGGWLMLDNSDRPEYDEGVALLAGWERDDFRGEWLTSIFRRPPMANDKIKIAPPASIVGPTEMFFLGGKVAHRFCELDLLERVMLAAGIKNVLEIGTGSGVLTTLFGIHAMLRGGRMMTVEKSRVLNKGRANLLEMLSVNVYCDDCFCERIRNAARAFLDVVGKPTLVYCDGGDKPKELATFAPECGIGDIIGVHDWGVELDWKDVPDVIKTHFEPLLDAEKDCRQMFWQRVT